MCSGGNYNPENNTWSPIPDIQHSRSRFSVGVIDERIIVIGGDSMWSSICHIEYFDEKAREWFVYSEYKHKLYCIFLKWRYIFIAYRWLATEFKCSNPSSIFSLTRQESLFRKSLYIWNCGRRSISEASAEQQLWSRRSQTFEMLLCVVW
jgi:hypothetical protein